MRNDFDGCVRLYKDFIKQASLQPELNISAVDVDDREDDQKKGTADVTDRYYKAEEYKKLSYEQKGQLKKLRAKRKGPDLSSQKVAALQASLEEKKQTTALHAKISALQAEIDELEDSLGEGKGSDEEASSGNCNHSTLTRQPKKRKVT